MKMSRFGEAVSYFGEVLEVSPATVASDWRMARAWLTRQMAKEPHS